MEITQETRREGYNRALSAITPRQALIISALRTGPMTAAEVADKLGFGDLNVAVREKGGLIGLGYIKPWRAESPAIGRGVQCHDSPEAMSFCQNCPLEECAPSLCGNPYLPGTNGFGERRVRPGRLDPDEIRRLIATGCSANETARILGAHRSTIYYWIKKLGIQAPKDGWSTLQKARVYGT